MGKRRHGYRHVNSTDAGNRIRVRGKRLDQVDETKLTLAYWLLAKQLVADKTHPRLPSAAEVQEQAKAISDEETDAYRRRQAS
jgi:hypothetical protein